MSSLAQNAYEQIRHRIASGQLTPETSLSETSLALELQVSRTPIREAIRRLECEGLLEQRPKQGTFVRAPNRREMLELFELRIYLEPPAAARAARKRRPELIERLGRLIEEMNLRAQESAITSLPPQQLGLYRQHMVCDRAFHEAILQDHGNRRMSKVVNDARVLSAGLGTLKDRPTVWIERMKQADREHAAILLAILQGDSCSAHRAMRHHLVCGRRNATDYFKWIEEQRGL